VPLNLIEAAYATPVGQASRKIIDIGEPQADDAVVAALFQIADMLIFTPYAFAAALKLEVVPTSVEQLLPVQSRIARHNQGVVVRFPGHGAAAVWADRFIFVEKTEDRNLAGSRARFSGTIAAAVAQKIGPEPALVMALAEVDVAG
jgi:hypothetical protein